MVGIFRHVREFRKEAHVRLVSDCERICMKCLRKKANDGCKAGAPISLGQRWKSIDFKNAETEVRHLQVRIAKAMKEGKSNKVKALQWLLTHSWSARVLAVRRVTRNKGSRTPGIDGEIWNTPAKKMRGVLSLNRKGYRALPLRRIKIPKGKGGFRNLGIPCMKDRAMQALYLTALEPVAEMTADLNSYGFRRLRACRDAIEQCFIALGNLYSAQWVLDADIRACFDWIDHKWLLENIPMDRKVLKEWLRCGFVEKGQLFPTQTGTPQGGIASPTLANMALDGLEQVVKKSCPYRCKVNFIRYADDFIVTAKTPQLLRERVIPAIKDFLAKRGLCLSETKTKIVNITEGLDFLGQTLRKFRGKLIIQPSKQSIHRLLEKIRIDAKRFIGARADKMVDCINSRIRGWCNFHRYVQSRQTFSYIDHYIFKTLWQWTHRQHPKKSRRWRKKKYFPNGDWCFTAKVKLRDKTRRIVSVLKAVSIRLYRYIKIRGAANPFDPVHHEYFEYRRTHAPIKLIGNVSRFDHKIIAGSC